MSEGFTRERERERRREGEREGEREIEREREREGGGAREERAKKYRLLLVNTCSHLCTAFLSSTYTLI